MLRDRRLVAGLVGLLTASRANAACSSNLLIDNFTKWISGVNNLDWQNGGGSDSPGPLNAFIDISQMTGA
jgi:hypothetical protein